jgi:hypothetical protein
MIDSLSNAPFPTADDPAPDINAYRSFYSDGKTTKTVPVRK